MREPLLDILRCPRCANDRSFALGDQRESDDREIRTATLTCGSCGFAAPVERGVAMLMPDAPEIVSREAAGLQRFADLMRSDGWDRERVLNLPDEPSDYWRGQRKAIDHLLATVDLEPGARVLDVGSNTCWASNILARQGLDVVALDISTHEMQGLFTADWWFEKGDADGEPVYFERVLTSMAEPALASASFDYVFASEVLHHNQKPELEATLRELHRVLKPGGLLIVLSEPLRFPTNLKRDHGEEVAEFEGNENVYFAHEYLLAARRAGFSIQLVEPRQPEFTGEPLWLTSEASALGSVKVFGRHMLRRSRLGRRALLGYTLLLGPDAPLAMLCRKAG